MKSLSNIFKKNLKSAKSPAKGFSRSTFKPSNSEVFDFIDLINSWPHIIGDRLANVTTPLKHINGKLVILTAHAAFSQQLSLMEKEILQKIVKSFPVLKNKIKSIRFQTNDQYFKKNKIVTDNHKDLSVNKYNQQNQMNRFSPSYKKVKIEAESYFADIECKETRNSLINLFIQLKNGQ